MIKILIFPKLHSAYEDLSREYYVVHIIELFLHLKRFK